MAKRLVHVEARKGWLRLRWQHKGKRSCFSLGIPDTPLGRRMAEGKASEIEADLITGNYDPTLVKYRGECGPTKSTSSLTVVKLFERYADLKIKGRGAGTREKYQAVLSRLRSHFGDAGANVDVDSAELFRNWISGQVSPQTAREYLRLINSAWEWGKGQGLTGDNPWCGQSQAVEVPPKQRPRAFTPDEVRAILEGFKASKYYAYYLDLVSFLLDTGCRTGEAIALRWEHLSDDCSTVWIGQAYSRGRVKGTKTNKARRFRLSKALQTLLLNRRPPGWTPESLVFPAKGGGPINLRAFRRSAWTKVLAAAEVRRLTPYKTRHTHITLQLKNGLKPMAIAERTGHDPQVLFNHYAADIDYGEEIPTLL